MSRKAPTTPAEWQEAVNLAHVCLLFDSARQYGLISGGFEVNVGRCETLLDRGKRRGIVPQAEEVERLIQVLSSWRR